MRVGDDSLVIGILEYLQVNFYNGDYDHDVDDDVPASCASVKNSNYVKILHIVSWRKH